MKMKWCFLLFASFALCYLTAQVNGCSDDSDCNFGTCQNGTECECTAGYITFSKGGACDYEQKDKTTAFCLSFFLGGLGADWFYLARGNGGFITAGVFKLITGT